MTRRRREEEPTPELAEANDKANQLADMIAQNASLLEQIDLVRAASIKSVYLTFNRFVTQQNQVLTDTIEQSKKYGDRRVSIFFQDNEPVVFVTSPTDATLFAPVSNQALYAIGVLCGNVKQTRHFIVDHERRNEAMAFDQALSSLAEAKDLPFEVYSWGIAIEESEK